MAFDRVKVQWSHSVLNKVYDHKWWRTNAQGAVWPTAEAGPLAQEPIGKGLKGRAGVIHSFTHSFKMCIHTHTHTRTCTHTPTHRAVCVPVKVLGFRDIILSRINMVPELTIE